MTRKICFLSAALFLGAASAHATEYRIVVRASDHRQLWSKVLEAASKVCAKARANDPFGDFGTETECIDNTVREAVSFRRP